VSGTKSVGHQLTASSAWNLAGVTVTYEWRKSGSIVGTGPTFTPESTGSYTVTATAVRDGYPDGTASETVNVGS